MINIALFGGTSSGCITKNDNTTPATPAADRFTVTFDGEVGGAWIQVLHDNELNTTVYRSADGYGWQRIAVISDKDL